MIPGQEIKILHVTVCGPKKKKKKILVSDIDDRDGYL